MRLSKHWYKNKPSIKIVIKGQNGFCAQPHAITFISALQGSGAFVADAQAKDVQVIGPLHDPHQGFHRRAGLSRVKIIVRELGAVLSNRKLLLPKMGEESGQHKQRKRRAHSEKLKSGDPWGLQPGPVPECSVTQGSHLQSESVDHIPTPQISA